MRVLNVITSMDPKYGGPQAGLAQFCRSAQSLGHEMDVVSFDAPGSRWDANIGINVFPLGPSVSRYAYAPRVSSWMERTVERYDALIVHGIWQYHAAASRRAALRAGRPYFVFVHGMLDPWFKTSYPLKHFKKWILWHASEYRVLRDATALLFTCCAEQRRAAESFGSPGARSEIVSLGIDRPQGDTREQVRSFLRRFPHLEAHGSPKRILLFLSRVHPVKGCDLLIEGFAAVARLDTSLHLVVAGPDQVGLQASLVDRARSLGVSDRVTWAGPVSGDLKWGALHSAELLVLPSHAENFGMVVVEALACGVPALVSDKVGIASDVQEYGCAIVTADTVQGVEAGIREWLARSSDERTDMSRRASECFENRYKATDATRRLFEVLKAP